MERLRVLGSFLDQDSYTFNDYMYPLVMSKMAIEHGHLQRIYPL